MKETILVTGVAGFIGSHLAKKLHDEGYEIIGIDNLSTGQEKNIPSAINFIEADLVMRKSLDLLSGLKISAICHLAAQSSGEISFADPVYDLNCNVVSTLNLINFCRENSVQRFLFASSMAVYGDVGSMATETMVPNPKSYYGISKLAAEQYLKLSYNEFDVTIFRLSNIYGPGQDLGNLRQGMVSIYLAQALASGHIVVRGSLERARDFLYVSDLVNIWSAVLSRQHISESLINLGSGVATSVGDLISVICTLMPCSVSQESGTPGDQVIVAPDITRLKSMVGSEYEFVSLEDGIRAVLGEIKN